MREPSPTDCRSVREGLWPPERPRLAGEWVVEARLHVDRCPACRDYFEQDRALLEVYDRLRGIEAPPRVREKVFDVLAGERTGSSEPPSRARGGEGRSGLPRWSRFGAAGAIAAGALAAVLLATDPPEAPGRGSAMFVEDYLRRAVSHDRITTSDPGEVRRFLARELGMSLSPLRIAGLELAGAEICLLEGRRGAMIRYRTGGEVVSHYIVPRQGGETRAPAVAEPSPGPRGGAGPAVVVWSGARVEQALVGPLPAARLLELARRAAGAD